MQISFTKTIEPLIVKSGKKALEAGKNMNYTLAGAKTGECVYTKSCNSCSAFLLNAGEHNFLTHIDPKTFNMRTFAEALKSRIYEFQEKFGAAKALIIGGWETNRKDSFVPMASDLVYSTMAIVADELPLSMICGKKIGVKPFENVFANKNQITIGCDTFETLGITKGKHTAEELEEKLSKCYEWAEIDKTMLK